MTGPGELFDQDLLVVPVRAPSLGESSAVMAAGTLLSRLTGFLRVVVVLWVLSDGLAADAYNYANSVPNIVYDLLLGGILSATLVPVFVDELRRRHDGGDEAIEAVCTAIGVLLLVASAALWILAPVIIDFYLLVDHRPGAVQERAVATSLLRLFAPQVFFLGAIVVSTALLNARRRFAAAAFSPVLNNLIAVAALGVTALVVNRVSIGPFSHDRRAILILGVGTTAGYLAQLLVQIPAMRRAQVVFRPRWNPRHPTVRRVVVLSGWLVGVVLTNQAALAVIMLFAAQRGGGYSAYQTAYTFFQLPYSLFAVSVAAALTPDLAERWSRADRRGFANRMIRGLRVTLAILVPAAVGYAVLARPLITLAVHHGHVTSQASTLVASALILFAVGLPGFSAFVLLMRGFQAMKDGRTMFLLYAAENALTVIAAVVLFPVLGIPGLALAWVAPYSVVALVAARWLGRRIGTLGGALTIRALARIAVASGVMLGVLIGIGHVFPAAGGYVVVVGRLSTQLVAGTAVYVGAAKALGIEELTPVLRLGRRLLHFP